MERPTPANDPDEPISRELLGWILDGAEALGVSRTTLDLAYLTPTRQNLSWDEFAGSIDEIAARLSSSELSRLAQYTSRAGWLGQPRPWLSWIIVPADQFTFVGDPSYKDLIPCLSCLPSIPDESDRQRVRVEVVLEPGRRPCPPVWELVRGVLASAPTVLGMPEASVEIEITELGARYEIRAPEARLSAKLLRPLWSARRATAATRAVARAAHFANLLHTHSQGLATRQRESEAALLLTNDRLTRAEHVSKTGSWERRLGDETSYWSAAHYRLMGLEPYSIPARFQSFAEMLHPDDADAFWQANANALNGGRDLDVEYRIQRADGETRILHTLGEVDFDSEGRASRIVGTTRDVTEQRTIERNLIQSQARMQRIVDTNIIGIFIAALDGRIVECNRAFRTMLGYAPEDTLPSWRELTPIEWSERDKQAVRDLGETGITEPYEREFIHKDGRSLPVLAGASRLQDPGDQAVAFILDISAKKRVEAELEHQRRHLEELVEERTQQLEASQAHLRHKERLASMGTLAAGIAHQINNPVGAILSSAEFALLSGSKPDHESTWLAALETHADLAERCGRIVSSLLQFARNEETEKWVEDINGVVAHAVQAVRPYAQNRNAKLRLRCSGVDIRVEMSPIQLEQAVVNLLENAIESRPSGAVVEIETELIGDRAVIRVRDNGTGIAPDVQPHVFDPFFTQRGDEGGSGLGLSVAHGVVIDHGGEINVRSEVSKGSCFTIELPRYDERATPLSM